MESISRHWLTCGLSQLSFHGHCCVQSVLTAGVRICPELDVPMARLFGKDGRGSGREIVITAQLQLTIEADGESTNVIVFVQPDSEQRCLLGMNVLPALGLSVRRANGDPLIVKERVEPVVSHIRLIQSSTIPCMKDRV